MNATARAKLLDMLARARAARRSIVPKAPRAHYPRALEAEYGARLASLVRDIVRPYLAPVLAELPDLMAAARRRIDSRQGDIMKEAKRRLRASIDTRGVDALARKYAGRVADYNAGAVRRQLRAGLGADPFIRDPRMYEVIDTFAQRNVQLIVDASERAMMDVDGIVQSAVGSAKRWEDVAAEIEAATGMPAERARLIARDQIGKLYGQINADRQQEMGVTRFTWRTSGDERVRPEHAALDGRVFRWDNPPDDGKFGPVIPGEAINCRCSADPVIEDALGLDAPDDGEAWST